ncbi:hypothetical protein [Romboutsia sp.]|uniref:hypothetical protein n=1 Tax=Romboutsia sp. TaxID=1965302 RepID=UPI003F3A7D63
MTKVKTKDTFMISPLLLLLPILTIGLSIMGFKSVYCMLTGVIAGSLISIFTQGIEVFDLIKYIVFGYKVNTGSTLVNNILLGGGIYQMLTVVF